MKRDVVDVLFSRYIKLLSGGYCKKCGKYFGVNSRGLQCAHWNGRGRMTTRYERDNCQALCTYCHFYLDGHPLEKTEFFIGVLGQKRAKEISVLSNKTLKDLGETPASFKEKVKADLRAKIKLLEGKNE